MSKHRKTDMDLARDDLMSHIHRCGVLKAAPEHQMEWMDDTIEYLGECYPALSTSDLGDLKQIGIRFCQPVIPHGKGNTALTMDNQPETEAAADKEESGSEHPEMVGV